MSPTALSAAHPSPKRKRDQAPPVPLLNTKLRIASTPPRNSPSPSGADSPRNAVAEQLRGMSLTGISAIPMSPLTPVDDGFRKKAKVDEVRVDSATDVVEHVGISSDANKMQKDALLYNSIEAKAFARPFTRDIAETPEVSSRHQPRTYPDAVATAKPVTFESSPILSPTSSSSTIAASVSRYPSITLTQTTGVSFSPDTNIPQPHVRTTRSPSPLPSALTWQDSEITGHLANPMTDPDDDGTGLNGIGFRPTPAIAYARAQRRKQQVLDWKAREAREARARRSERRRRGAGGASSRSSTVEREMRAPVEELAMTRIVKFAV